MKMKKLLALIFVLAGAIGVMAACSGGSSGSSGKLGYQLDKPAEGEDIAVLTTSKGTVKLRLFPKAAPKAVENFEGLVKKGYYDGLIFHRVINNFMVQTGDPTGTGKGGESIWKQPFEDEFNPDLLNLRGAVSMANSGKNTNGSQFFINQTSAASFAGWDQFNQMFSYYKQSKMTADDFAAQYGTTWLDMDKATDEYRKLYEKNGGNPYLDGYYNLDGRGHTVFAQVYEGMDIVDQIAAVDVDSNDKPIEDVKIVKAEIQKYKP